MIDSSNANENYQSLDFANAWKFLSAVFVTLHHK